MKNPILEQVINQFNNFFSAEKIDVLSRESSLLKRSNGKFNPFAFLMMMIIDLSSVGSLCLREMCDLMVGYGGVRITPQALSLRLGLPSTLRFLKLVYAAVLEDKLFKISFQLKEEGIMGRFVNVYLEDSTSCKLHEKVSNSYKGCGGSSSRAGYKIHTVWNAAKNCINKLTITPSYRSDQSQAFNILPTLKTGDLVLRDLGYFSIPCFREVHDIGAYFVSRLKPNVNLYTVDGKPIDDIGKFVDKVSFNSGVVEVNVLLGCKEKLPVRLIAHRVPQSTYDQRMRKIRRKEQKSGNTVSKKTKAFNKYNFFITNVPREKLANDEVLTVYKLRWQIELLFKSFKGDLHVDMLKGQSETRVDCYIVSKLIVIMLTATLYGYLSFEIFIEHGRELSFFKFLRWVLSQKYFIILFKPGDLRYSVQKMKEIDIMQLCKQKRSRMTSRELLELEVIYSEIFPDTFDIQPLKTLA